LLTVLPADKGNAAVVLGTSDYNQKIATLMQVKAYAKLKRGSHGIYRTQDCSPPEEALVC
jgi:hypothetical protein